MSAKAATSGARGGLAGRLPQRGRQLEQMLSRHPSTGERAVGTGRGAGGDNTLIIDAQAEEGVFAELERLHAQGHEFTAVSEERGEVRLRRRHEQRARVDRSDRRLAQRQAPDSRPTRSASRVAGGETMEDVEFAYVYDFGTREEFVAGWERAPRSMASHSIRTRWAPGWRSSASSRPGRSGSSPVAARLVGKIYRMRVVGSIAISLCWVAATRFDGMLTANTCRSFDAAAGQLIAREAGAFVSVLGHGGIEAPLDLGTRFRMAAARTPEGLETLVRALTEAGLPE